MATRYGITMTRAPETGVPLGRIETPRLAYAVAMTDGRKTLATPQQVRSVTALWSAQFARAPYVWLETGSQGQIPWTPALYAYFTSHFRLLGLVNGPGVPGAHDVPEGGLYVRR
jgi:hypothetical protein